MSLKGKSMHPEKDSNFELWAVDANCTVTGCTHRSVGLCVIMVVFILKIGLGGNNNLRYLRWNWIFCSLFSPNWMWEWSVCTMSLCPWLFSPAICMQWACACIWIHTKSHRLYFPAVRSLYPQNKKKNGFLIVMIFVTLPCSFLVVFRDLS